MWAFTYTHKRGGKKFLVISAKFKPIIRKAKLFLTIFSLGSAYIAFDNLHYAFVVGLITWLITSVLERFLFSYDICIVHPMPNFTWQGDKWLSVGFGYAEGKDDFKIPCVTLQFDSRDYAIKVHDLLLSWTGGELNDEDGFVQASVVLHDTQPTYVFRIYPSIQRSEELERKSPVDPNFYDENPDMVLRRTHAMMCLGKECEMTNNSFLPRFMQMYREDNVPILLAIYGSDENRQAVELDGYGQFIIHKFKIRKHQNLTRKDQEYQMHKIRPND